MIVDPPKIELGLKDGAVIASSNRHSPGRVHRVATAGGRDGGVREELAERVIKITYAYGDDGWRPSHGLLPGR
jgi:hypothetical protein